ncbi:MAG: tryptophan--tRNA ligase [Chloroflexales bacterium]
MLHIGNYLGAIQQWVAGQGQKTNFICIVDLHAITVPQEPADLRRQTRELATLLIAAGIDPQQTTLFVQSHVRAHAEACWLLTCMTPLGWLERMTQYKSKAQRQESVLAGLLNYPVLMAVDILLYDTDEVPVGDDQKQHVELTRDIAQRFNGLYGETFVVPKPVIRESGARIMALNDPAAKMSKSDFTRGHAIRVNDTPDEIRWVIKRAVTDALGSVGFSDDPARAGVNNLLQIYELFTGQSRAAIESHFAGKGYGALKADVAEAVIEGLRPIRERFDQLIGDPAELDRILAIGASQARAVADQKLLQVMERVGFVLPNAEC